MRLRMPRHYYQAFTAISVVEVRVHKVPPENGVKNQFGFRFLRTGPKS
jgi:hypothetical protein